MIDVHHLRVPRTARVAMTGAFAPARGVREVWFLLHGYGQLAPDFLGRAQALAAPHRLLVAPEALSRFYVDRTRPAGDGPATVGASWMTREEREHEIRDQVSYLDALWEHVMTGIGGDTSTVVYALGFSQGVATVMRWLTLGTSRLDHVICWAGSLPPEIDPARDAARLATVTLTMVGGSRDEFQPWLRSAETIRRLTEHGIAIQTLGFEGGHRLDDTTLARLGTPAA